MRNIRAGRQHQREREVEVAVEIHVHLLRQEHPAGAHRVGVQRLQQCTVAIDADRRDRWRLFIAAVVVVARCERGDHPQFVRPDRGMLGCERCGKPALAVRAAPFAAPAAAVRLHAPVSGRLRNSGGVRGRLVEREYAVAACAGQAQLTCRRVADVVAIGALDAVADSPKIRQVHGPVADPSRETLLPDHQLDWRVDW
jgi:hypothetical protein